jgi:hypothetical protein
MVAAGARAREPMTIRPALRVGGAVTWEADDPIYDETHTED